MKSPLAILLTGGIRAYRFVFSARPSPCRFDPTCSQYGLDALEGHGALRGSWLTIRRISRCRPGGGQGYDPAPPRAITVDVSDTAVDVSDAAVYPTDSPRQSSAKASHV
jgi:uncharacterized protein